MDRAIPLTLDASYHCVSGLKITEYRRKFKTRTGWVNDTTAAANEAQKYLGPNGLTIQPYGDQPWRIVLTVDTPHTTTFYADKFATSIEVVTNKGLRIKHAGNMLNLNGIQLHEQKLARVVVKYASRPQEMLTLFLKAKPLSMVRLTHLSIDSQVAEEDLVLVCKDGEQVRINSTLARAACETVAVHFRSDVGDPAEKRSTFDLSKWSKASVQSVKDIITRGTIQETDVASADVIDLLHYLQVRDHQSMWALVQGSLRPENALHAFGAADLHGNQPTMDMALKIIMENMSGYNITDPQAFVQALTFNKAPQ